MYHEATERAMERPIERSSNRANEQSIGTRSTEQVLAMLNRINECITTKNEKTSLERLAVTLRLRIFIYFHDTFVNLVIVVMKSVNVSQK